VADPVAQPVKRLPKQTLHHAWAPKLNRTIVLAGRDQLHLWVMLEAHPAVTRYCERPSWPDETEPYPVPDFWALRDGTPVWLALLEPPQPQADPAAEGARDPGVMAISGEGLDQHRVWIQNWLSLLPYLGPASAVDLDALVAPVVNAVGQDTCIDDVERHFPTLDPLLVRSAVISALHQGRIVSADLRHRPWDRFTRLCRLPDWRPHATR
jgi:hypothetical protein